MPPTKRRRGHQRPTVRTEANRMMHEPTFQNEINVYFSGAEESVFPLLRPLLWLVFRSGRNSSNTLLGTKRRDDFTPGGLKRSLEWRSGIAAAGVDDHYNYGNRQVIPICFSKNLSGLFGKPARTYKQLLVVVHLFQM